ncbi:MAG: hypothetical protein B7X59_08445 [Polaromonas sp. 39-63-203]|nr:MAG: hypothetical protein B7Y54_08285 [Polaromonas sp. 35-63-240]OYZ02064.1 MAG: hypothetical protein B7Y42_02700 [Polaromonas sp. 28-63-22]OYZ83509.1 MAG: hypothetical protein B7Y03_08820 [Polaromonas sp. 24-62-144]OZA97135.1 MAG: hypothetical protein B7X59_08445 [Polaromonas sp. 39-63-203]
MKQSRPGDDTPAVACFDWLGFLVFPGSHPYFHSPCVPVASDFSPTCTGARDYMVNYMPA